MLRTAYTLGLEPALPSRQFKASVKVSAKMVLGLLKVRDIILRPNQFHKNDFANFQGWF